MPIEFDNFPPGDPSVEWIACQTFNQQAAQLEQAATLGISAAAQGFVYAVSRDRMLVRRGWQFEMLLAIWLLAGFTAPP